MFVHALEYVWLNSMKSFFVFFVSSFFVCFWNGYIIFSYRNLLEHAIFKRGMVVDEEKLKVTLFMIVPVGTVLVRGISEAGVQALLHWNEYWYGT